MPEASRTWIACLLLVSVAATAGDAVTACRKHYDDAAYESAARACRQAAEAGDATSQTLLGELYDQGLGVAASAPLARHWWQAAAAQSHLPALNLLALKYYYGGEVFQAQAAWPQDYARAFALWRQSATQGVAASQFMLGEMTLRGQGVKADLVRAYAWFRLALAGGYKMASDSLTELSRIVTPAQRRDGEKVFRRLQQEFSG